MTAPTSIDDVQTMLAGQNYVAGRALATVVFLPIVLAYTAWVYHVMRGPVNAASIGRNPNAY